MSMTREQSSQRLNKLWAMGFELSRGEHDADVVRLIDKVVDFASDLDDEVAALRERVEVLERAAAGKTLNG